MIALIRKESEALAPYWIAFALLGLVGLVLLPWDVEVLARPLAARLEDDGMDVFLVLLLSFMVGHGSVADELREGHVEFLDALPTTRAHVFAAKAIACLGPCALLVGVSAAHELALLAVAAPPLGASSLQPLAASLGIQVLAAFGGVGVGMLLSWVGGLAWGVLGLGLTVAACAGVVSPPVRAWVPFVGTFGTLSWDGPRATHPIAPLVGLVLVGGGAMAASGLLFLGPGRGLVDRSSRWIAALRWGLAGCLGLTIIPFSLLFGLIGLATWGETLLLGVERVETRDFRVLYAPGGRAEALEVAAGVDALSEEIGRLLDHAEPLRLDIELLDTPENHAGAFTGGKIRMLAGQETLVHELTHAHAHAIAGRALYTQRAALGSFGEGLAEWVTARVLERPEVNDVSAAIWALHRPDFSLVVDAVRLNERHDPRVQYELGRALVAALVDVGGPGAAGCLLREIAPLTDHEIAPLALWYGISGRCGLDLDAARARYAARLDAAAADLPPLPRLRARVDRDADALWVRDERELGLALRCGFRDNAETPTEHTVWTSAPGGRCEIPRARLTGGSFQYTAGFVLPGDPAAERSDVRTIYLPWATARP